MTTDPIPSDLVAGDEELRTARAAIEDLVDERRRLLDLVVRLPGLLAEREPRALVAGVAQACCELTDARFALYVPAEADAEPILTGAEWDDFAERPDVGNAPLLAGPRLHGQAHSVVDVAAWARDDRLSTAYGALADGRLVRSWVIAPVPAADGELAGVLYLGHPRPHAFDAEAESLAAGLCNHLGAAIVHAQVSAERDRVASALEATLLPPVLPRIAGVDLAARYRATGRSDVGGDFYDAFPLGGDHWAVVLGDVSGSGPDAAAITGVARYSIRAIAPAVVSPAGVLARLNEALLRQAVDDRFLTAVLVRLTSMPDRVEALLANGGHPPAMILHDDESVTVLDRPSGMLLGMLPGRGFQDVPVTLHAGDALVLYTDGVVEARNAAGEQFGQDRLVALLSTCAGRSAAGIARRIELAAQAHSPALSDDMAIVVLRRL
ncbi:MAG TPA: GAF domain-containing SpoIIE family protein phosphatase [Acidimicrobiales bacterium]|nr:GAF domain-containing SpoIIE family protein phosphatase [Acidimicrobiales bacterium]